MSQDLPRTPRPMNAFCLYCGGNELVPYALGIRDHLRIAPRKHDSFKCTQCGSLRLVPLPEKEYLENSYPKECYFNKESGNWLRKLWNRFEWRLFYEPVLRFSTKLMIRETKILSGRVLDVGCGNGLRLLRFSDAGYETEGIDFASMNVQYAREVLGLTVWEANVEEAELPVSRYHLVMAYWMMEHLLKPIELTRKVRNSLIKNGWAIFAVPLADSWVSMLFREHWGQIREAPRHISIPTTKGMFRLLGTNGFENIKSKPVSALELAGDVALTLWPRGNFFMPGKWAFLKILDRALVGLLTLLFLSPVYLLKKIGIQQGLAVFIAQKTTA